MCVIIKVLVVVTCLDTNKSVVKGASFFDSYQLSLFLFNLCEREQGEYLFGCCYRSCIDVVVWLILVVVLGVFVVADVCFVS